MGELQSNSPGHSGSRAGFVYAIAMVAAFSEFIRGYDLSVISGAIIFLVSEFELTEMQEGFAVSCPLLGCLVGAPIGGYFSDRIGRKNTLYITAILYGVSAIGTAIPSAIETFYVYRILGGVGVGIASVVAPMYIAEVAPAVIRGRLVIVGAQLCLVTGALISIIITWWLAETGSWRWMFGLECVPVLFFLGLLFLVPRSPRWLAQKNRFDEARDVLTRINGPEHADQELKDIRASLQEESGTWRELFDPGLRTALMIAVCLALFQQFSGVDTTMYYAALIFKKAGVDSATGAIGRYVIIAFWNLLLTITSIWLIERVGRRPLFLFGLPVMAVGQALMGLCFHLELPPRFLLLCFFVSVGGYILSIAPLFWVIVAEIFPTRVRAKAIASSVFILWSASFLVKLFFPSIRDFFETRSGSPAGAFWLFASVCVMGFLFCLKMVPETRGRSLEAIGRSWKD